MMTNRLLDSLISLKVLKAYAAAFLRMLPLLHLPNVLIRKDSFKVGHHLGKYLFLLDGSLFNLPVDVSKVGAATDDALEP